MKVAELIEVLKTLDPETLVVMASDSEGNSFSPLVEAQGNMAYLPENTWSGDVFGRDGGPDDAGIDQEEWDKLMKTPPVVVLWPTN